MTSNDKPIRRPIFRPGKAPRKPALPPSGMVFPNKPEVTPDESRKIIEARPLPKVTKAPVKDATASDVVEGALSIVELARALQGTQTVPYSPQTFYEFVYDNIDLAIGYGEAKGALGTLQDGCGNPFDQCALLAALLRQVGFTVNYQVGQILLTVEQVTAWLGVTDSTIGTAEGVFTAACVPWTEVSGELQIGHCWLQVNIGTEASPNWVVMDPSFKTYTTTSGIDLATATGYVQSDFLADARSGYTIDLDGNWVQNINRTNIRNDLQTYATSLISWIQTNNPTATMDEIIGGREIVPVTLPVTFPTTLPYWATGTTITTFTGDFTDAYKVTVEFAFPGFPDGSITLTSDQIYGHRLTWFYTETSENYYTPTLALDGVEQATGTAQEGGSYNSIEITVTHMAYAVDTYNQTFYQTVYAPNEDGYTGQTAYLIGTSFGPAGKGALDYHEALAYQNEFDSSEVFSEPALGEQLACQWANYTTQVSRLTAIVNQLTTTIFFNHHTIGTAAYQDYGTPAFSLFDIEGVTGSGAVLNSSVSNIAAAGINANMHAYATEMLAIQQLGGQEAVSTTRDIDVANSAGTQIYKATPSNWSGTVEPALSGYSAYTSDIYDQFISIGDDVLLAQTAGQVFGDWTLDAWAGINPAGGATGIIFSQYSGGAGPGKGTGTPPDKDDDCEDDDPVDIRTGDYHYRHEDLTVGSQLYPYSLSFKSSYDSRVRLTNGPLGLGWNHNWNIKVTVQSDGLSGLGSDSPISAAASIAELFVTLDILNISGLPVDILVTASVAQQWWVDQMTNNVVVMSVPDDRDYAYVLLPDGSYNPPLRDASTLTLSAGVYTHTTPQKVVSTFNTAGQLASIAYPSGVTITLTYSSGILQSVTNGMGRTLTLGYTGGLITSVSDGTGRSVGYAFDGNDQLITFTDALSQNYTFGYVSPGLLYQYFKPQNPSNACITNTYDSLNRVESQVDILGHTNTFYLAGSRSQTIDPVGNSSVTYYDANDNPIVYIDALNNISTRVFDGLGRLVQFTLPEGNYNTYTYDQFNNMLTITKTPKPGSGLSPILLTNTYNPTWNKVYQATDGNGNTTAYFYDPTYGNLIKIQRPAVTGGTPTVNKIWNTRGQLLSTIDESGVQTQLTYDTSTEKLLSLVLNTNWTATIGGTIVVDDILTLTAHNTALSGGQESVHYMVESGDTYSNIAAGLAAAVNADTNLAALGIVAYANGPLIALATATVNTTTWTESVSGTETITLTTGLNLTTNLGYDSVGNLSSVQDPRGNTTSLQFDSLRRLTLRTEAAPFSYQTEFGYDKNSNLLTLQRQTGISATPWQTYTWTYTLSDKKSTLTDPSGNVSSWFYDGADRLQKTQDALLHAYQFAYDQLNRLYTLTDPTLVVAETRGYSPNGNLTSVEDALTNLTNFSFDGFDRPNETIYPDATYEQNLLYDSNGNVKTSLTRLGATIGEIAFQYDALNRLTQKAPYGQPTETYVRDLAGRLLSVTDSSLGEYQRQYDTAGRFYQEIYPNTYQVTFSLDANDNVTELVYPDGYFVTKNYDQLNRLTSVSLNGAAGPSATFSYDDLSRRSTLIFGSLASVNYAYALNDDLTELVNTFVGSEVTMFNQFNGVHQIQDQYLTNSNYLWAPGNLSVTYSQGTVANDLNQYPNVNGVAYSYNNNGCLTGDGVWTHIYDTENHLLESSAAGTSVARVYDPFHRQAQKSVTTSGTVSTNYFYSGWQKIADYDASTGLLQNRYVYGANLDEPIIQVTNLGELTFLHANHQGSIIATSDSAGVVTNINTYGPFGETSSLGGTSFGFTGQRYEPETGLYYYKRRYYSPTLGRFLQPDPIGYDLETAQNCPCDCSGFCSRLEPSQLNLYGYVQNDPLNMLDPVGEQGVAVLSSALVALAIALALALLADALQKAQKNRCPITLPPIEIPIQIPWSIPLITPITTTILQIQKDHGRSKKGKDKYIKWVADKMGKTYQDVSKELHGSDAKSGIDNNNDVKIDTETGDVKTQGGETIGGISTE